CEYGVTTDHAHDMANRVGHGIDMPRRAGHGLGEHAAVIVEHARRQVAGFAHGSRKCRAHQRQRLLLDHRNQPVPHDLVMNGINGVAHAACSCRRTNRHPSAWRMASNRVVTMVVVSRSTIMAGPATRWPVANVSRSTTAASQNCAWPASYRRRCVAASTALPVVMVVAGSGGETLDTTRTDQFMTSISSPTSGRPNRRAYSASNSAVSCCAPSAPSVPAGNSTGISQPWP